MKNHLINLGVGLVTMGVIVAIFEAFTYLGFFRELVITIVFLVVTYFLGMFIRSEWKEGYKGVC